MIKIKCKENKQDNCDIIEKHLGDCEIVENGEVMWRCPNYLGCEEVENDNNNKK